MIMHPRDLVHLDTVSAYFHIPFCRSKCTYCGFYSETGRDSQYMRQEIIRMLGMFTFFHDAIGFSSIRTVYLGGGTPSVLDRKSLILLCKGIRALTDTEPAEWTIEANPESTDKEFCAILKDLGIGRLSMGIQSFQPELRRCLGRIEPEEGLEARLEKILGVWDGTLNLDLITGIPGQTVAMAVEDAAGALGYHPDHLSLYTLSVEPGTVMQKNIRKGFYGLPKEEESEDMWFSASDVLTSAGYERYEVSNFAAPGKRCLHNTSYWSMKPYTGCGPTAVSTLPSKTGPVRLTFDTKHQLHREDISPSDFLLDYLIMGLRTIDGISFSELENVFNTNVFLLLGELISTWKNSGWIAEDKMRLRMTDNGLSILDVFLREASSILGKSPPKTIKWPSQYK